MMARGARDRRPTRHQRGADAIPLDFPLDYGAAVPEPWPTKPGSPPPL